MLFMKHTLENGRLFQKRFDAVEFELRLMGKEVTGEGLSAHVYNKG